MITRENAVLAFTPAADQSANEGYFVELSGGEVAVCNAATDVPFGVILHGDDTNGKSSIAVSAGGFAGTVNVKITDTSPGTIVAGTMLCLKADGTVQADSGSGARVQVAQALEAGAAEELIEAVLIKPVVLS